MPAPKTGLPKFTKKKKQQAFNELQELMVEKGALPPGLEYLYDWLHAELHKG